jgi:DNA-binding protein HU-beta
VTHNGPYGPTVAAVPVEVLCVGGAEVNKAQLIDALAERLGDKKVAAAAVAGLVDVVVRTVSDGDKVIITGFGVFEKRARAARTARNPRTGEAVIIRQTDVPAFRPGTLFREVVSGTRLLPQAGAATSVAAAPTSPSQPETSPAVASPPTTSGARRPATRVTPATRLTAVPLATAKAPKVVKAAKIKTSKAAKAAKTPKIDSKLITKLAGKGSAKKGGQKSATKKSATKK